jgi:hypothetical protein
LSCCETHRFIRSDDGFREGSTHPTGCDGF